jgi:hypothetical protein
MVQIAPQVYRKCVPVNKKGIKILYVKLQKALYELMRASLFFYRKLRREFEQYGIEVNLNNLCVANMTTKGRKHLMVVWHVDGLMALCKDNFELAKFLCYLAWLGKLPTCRQHVGLTVKCQHFWLTSPCRCNTKPTPTQYFCVGDCQHSPNLYFSTRATY